MISVVLQFFHLYLIFFSSLIFPPYFFFYYAYVAFLSFLLLPFSPLFPFLCFPSGNLYLLEFPLCRQLEWSSFVFWCTDVFSETVTLALQSFFSAGDVRIHGMSTNEPWCILDIERYMPEASPGGASKHMLRIPVSCYICFHDYFNYPWERCSWLLLCGAGS